MDTETSRINKKKIKKIKTLIFPLCLSSPGDFWQAGEKKYHTISITITCFTVKNYHTSEGSKKRKKKKKIT